MANNSPTIVAASLSDDQLKKSIDSLVTHVDEAMKKMVQSTNKAVGEMEAKLKSLGNIKIDSTGSADGGSSRRAKALSEESLKAKEVTMSYDQMQSVLQRIAKDNSGLKDIRTFNKEELQSYIDLLRKLQAEYVRVNTQEGGGAKSDQIKRDMAELEKIIQGYQVILKNVEMINSRQGTIDVKKWTQDIGAVDDRYKKLVRWYTVLEKEDQRRIANEEKANQKRLSELDKEEKARQKMIESARKAEEKYQNAVLKTAFNKIVDMPSNNIDQMRSKLERLQTILANIREMGILSPKDISNAETEIVKLRGNIQQIEKIERERIAAEKQFIIEQQKEIENLTTIEGRVKSLSQATKQYFAENKGEYWRTFNAYGKDFTIYNPEKSNRANGLSIEEQITNILKEEKAAREGASQAAQQQANSTQNVAKAQQEESAAIRKNFRDYDSLRQAIASVIGVKTEDVRLYGVQISSINVLSDRLKQFRAVYNQLGTDDRHSKTGKALIAQIQDIERQMDRARKELSRPIDMKSAFGLSEKTLDDIAYKMRQLASYKMGLNIKDPKAMGEMKQVDAEINRLKKDYDDLMGKNQSMIASNNALGRSWNYMKNRLAFYFTVGASTQFIKNLIDIRGQYELLERSIGILIDSAQNGSQIFAELNSMAIKSPFTTMELGAAAKQLVAYDVAAKDVVETTRRLADMAAAVGIPIERLTYALGQIKAYGYLNARDARMFANAGIPLVKELADRYTELEGRLVSTSDVYDRIKKKAISYEDVMATVNKMTDEGGKFFNFQEKAADTLKVRIANLTLAWNNMMNEMGAANQGVLSSGLKTLSDVFKNWRSIYNLINSIIVTFGVLKGTQIAVLTMQAMKLKENITLWNALEISMRKSIGDAFVNQLRSIGGLLAKFANPVYLAAAAVTALSVALLKTFYDYQDLIAANEAFNKSISDNAKENIESIDKFFEDYKKQFSNVGGLNSADQEKLWERIQEEIEKTTKNAKEYIDVLNDVAKTSSKIQFGEEILEHSKTMQEELKRLADSGTFSIGGGFANDSAAENLQKYQEALNEIRQEYGSVDAAIEAHTLKSRKLMAEYETQRDEVRKELNDFVSKLDSAYIPDILGQSDDVRIQMANVRSFAESLRDAFLATEKGSKIGVDGIVMLNSAIDKWITKQGIANNLIVNANGEFDEQRARIENNKTAWEEFFRYISNKDKEYLDAAIKTNNIGSDEVKKIWDKAAEEMSKRATTSYDLIQDQIAQLRNTPDIVINVVYKNAKQKLDKDQEEFEKRFIQPKNLGPLSTDEYLNQEKANREKYGTLMRKQGEENVEYEKRISTERKTNLELQKKNGDIIEENKNKTDAYSQAVTEQARKEKDAADNRLKAIKEIEDAGGYDFSTKSENAAARKAQKQAESELAKALKDELSTIDEVRSIYKDLTKEGMSHADAVAKATKGWDETVNAINKVLQKNGLKKLNLADFVGVDNPREMMKTLQAQLEEMVKRGASASEIKVIQEKIRTLEVDADKYDLTKITKGLNNELDKLKEEYELAVALDADPELGDVFAEMFDINVDELPHSINEYAERVTNELNDAIKKRKDKIQLPTITGLTKDDIKAFREMSESGGLNVKSFEEIEKAFTQFRELRQKAASDVAKIANDYIREYGDISAQIELIEKEKNNNLTKLNDVYNTEALRKTKDYTDAKAAIIEGAARKEAKATFDALKKSTDYERFFTAIDTITKKDALKIKNKIKAGIIDAFKNGGLTVSQFRKEIKNLEEQFDKLIEPTQGWVSYLNGGFDALIQKAKNTGQEIESIGEQISITGKVDEKDKNFLQSFGKIFSGGGEKGLDFTSLLEKFGGNIEGLGNAVSQAGQGMEGAAGSFASAISIVDMIIKGVHQTVQAIASVIDELNSIRSEDNKIGNAYWEGFKKFDNYAFSGWENLKSGNVAGAMGDTANSIISIFNAFSNAKNEKINKQLKESARTVKDLENAYKDLEVAVNKSLGDAETGARRVAIENKKLQLAELERQLQLEESRSSKRRDEDRIKELQGAIIDARNEIQNMTEDVVNSLTGEDVKNAAEEFVDAWVEAWKAGETTLDSIQEKMDDIIENIIKKAIASKIVGNLLKPFYDAVDSMTSETSEGGVSLTINELRQLAQQAGVKVEEINTALGEFYGNLANLGIISPTEESRELSALQQGISQISEQTANALEAYANSISQQAYLRNDLLTQIRDTIMSFDMDVQLGVFSQMLLQLQNNYIVMQSMQSMMENWTVPSGSGIRVELMS